jgi:hypothetical protein
MRQDITYKYLKFIGVIFGGMLVLLLIITPIELVRLKQILDKSNITIGRSTEYGIISRIDSSLFSYTFNFSEGEKVCFTVDTNLRKYLKLSVDSDGKTSDRNTCD